MAAQFVTATPVLAPGVDPRVTAGLAPGGLEGFEQVTRRALTTRMMTTPAAMAAAMTTIPGPELLESSEVSPVCVRFGGESHGAVVWPHASHESSKLEISSAQRYIPANVTRECARNPDAHAVPLSRTRLAATHSPTGILTTKAAWAPKMCGPNSVMKSENVAVLASVSMRVSQTALRQEWAAMTSERDTKKPNLSRGQRNAQLGEAKGQQNIRVRTSFGDGG